MKRQLYRWRLAASLLLMPSLAASQGLIAVPPPCGCCTTASEAQPDHAAMEDRWAKFMADQEWSDIKRRSAAEDGTLVGKIENRVLRLTDYSRPLG